MNRPIHTEKAKRNSILGIAFCLLSFFLVCLAVDPASLTGEKTVRSRALFLEEGLLDFDRTTSYPIDAGTEGMFGSLLDYLSTRGITSARTRGPFTDELLRSADILFVINATYRWSSDEIERIHSWVERGGVLIVLGDHTDLAGMTKSINPLIEKYGGTLNFETGDMEKHILKHGWKTAYHPSLFSVASSMHIYWGTGGTLSITYPLLPFIEGVLSFGDVGDYNGNSYFGNRRYEAGEHAGDIPLAAYAEIGKGKVLIGADTSPFLNGTIHLTWYPFLSHLFEWIQASTVMSGEKFVRWFAGLLLAVAISFFVFRRNNFFLIAILLGICIGVLFSRNAAEDALEFKKRPQPVAVIDLSHLPHFAADPFQNHSPDGLASMFMHGSYMPVAMWQFDPDLIAQARVVVMQQPAIEYSSSEKDELYDWVSRGGVLIVTGSYITPDAVNDFLESTHLRIGTTPLGAAYKNLDTTRGDAFIQVPNTAPIMYTQSARSFSVRLATEVLLENEGYPIVARVTYGAGNIIVFASDRILTSDILQNKEFAPRVQNIRWLQSILDQSMRQSR